MKPKAEPITPRLLSTKDAARYLGVSDWTLRQGYYKGKIQAIKVSSTAWLWDLKDLDAFVEKMKQK